MGHRPRGKDDGVGPFRADQGRVHTGAAPDGDLRALHLAHQVGDDPAEFRPTRQKLCQQGLPARLRRCIV